MNRSVSPSSGLDSQRRERQRRENERRNLQYLSEEVSEGIRKEKELRKIFRKKYNEVTIPELKIVEEELRSLPEIYSKIMYGTVIVTLRVISTGIFSPKVLNGTLTHPVHDKVLGKAFNALEKKMEKIMLMSRVEVGFRTGSFSGSIGSTSPFVTNDEVDISWIQNNLKPVLDLVQRTALETIIDVTINGNTEDEVKLHDKAVKVLNDPNRMSQLEENFLMGVGSVQLLEGENSYANPSFKDQMLAMKKAEIVTKFGNPEEIEYTEDLIPNILKRYINIIQSLGKDRKITDREGNKYRVFLEGTYILSTKLSKLIRAGKAFEGKSETDNEVWDLVCELHKIPNLLDHIKTRHSEFMWIMEDRSIRVAKATQLIGHALDNPLNETNLGDQLRDVDISLTQHPSHPEYTYNGVPVFYMQKRHYEYSVVERMREIKGPVVILLLDRCGAGHVNRANYTKILNRLSLIMIKHGENSKQFKEALEVALINADDRVTQILYEERHAMIEADFQCIDELLNDSEISDEDKKDLKIFRDKFIGSIFSAKGGDEVGRCIHPLMMKNKKYVKALLNGGKNRLVAASTDNGRAKTLGIKLDDVTISDAAVTLAQVTQEADVPKQIEEIVEQNRFLEASTRLLINKELEESGAKLLFNDANNAILTGDIARAVFRKDIKKLDEVYSRIEEAYKNLPESIQDYCKYILFTHISYKISVTFVKAYHESEGFYMENRKIKFINIPKGFEFILPEGMNFFEYVNTFLRPISNLATAMYEEGLRYKK